MDSEDQDMDSFGGIILPKTKGKYGKVRLIMEEMLNYVDFHIVRSCTLVSIYVYKHTQLQFY